MFKQARNWVVGSNLLDVHRVVECMPAVLLLGRVSSPHPHCLWPLCSACCFLVPRCLQDTFVREKRRLRDPRRLYPAGRLYHVVVKEPWR